MKRRNFEGYNCKNIMFDLIEFNPNPETFSFNNFQTLCDQITYSFRKINFLQAKFLSLFRWKSKQKIIERMMYRKTTFLIEKFTILSKYLCLFVMNFHWAGTVFTLCNGLLYWILGWDNQLLLKIKANIKSIKNQMRIWKKI